MPGSSFFGWKLVIKPEHELNLPCIARALALSEQRAGCEIVDRNREDRMIENIKEFRTKIGAQLFSYAESFARRPVHEKGRAGPQNIVSQIAEHQFGCRICGGRNSKRRRIDKAVRGRDSIEYSRNSQHEVWALLKSKIAFVLAGDHVERRAAEYFNNARCSPAAESASNKAA